MSTALSISGLTKTYASGLQALKGVDLTIERGEIFALLGPNGAGKTTLINIVCGIVTPTSGRVQVANFDVLREYRAARRLIGLVPQELATDMFESVGATVNYSRELFGCPRDPQRIERLLRDLALWERRRDLIMTLSGGMKRRVMIAKALSHEPQVLFLDEPTAGVDVELRRDMWELVRGLRERGVTIILTTHYIEEAEEMADRIGVINKGSLIVVQEKAALMHQLGRKELTLHLSTPLASVPEALRDWPLSLDAAGTELHCAFTTAGERAGIPALLKRLGELGIDFTDLNTRQSTLEEIFVSLVHEQRPAQRGAVAAQGAANAATHAVGVSTPGSVPE